MSKKPILKTRPAPGARTVVVEKEVDALEARLAAREQGAQTPERSKVQPPAGEARTPVAYRLPGTPAEPAVELPNIQTPGRPDSRIVARSGRLRADGTRTGARELRRSTIYLPPELAMKLDMYVVEQRRDRSNVIAEALAVWLSGRS